MISDEVSLSLETYVWCIQRLNLGEVHPTLVGGHLWYPDELLADRNSRVLAELRSQGLASGDRVAEAFEDTLIVMQRPAVEYACYARIEGVAVTVRAAAIGRDAVLVISAQRELAVEPIPYDQLAIRVVSALPDTPAARMHSATADVATLQALDADKQLPQGPRTADAKRMHQWLTRDRVNAGQLTAAVRSGAGKPAAETQAPVPTWFDTQEGRLLFHIDHAGWASLAGVGAFDLAAKFHDLEQTLRARRS